jgi:hypothetical protein
MKFWHFALAVYAFFMAIEAFDYSPDFARRATWGLILVLVINAVLVRIGLWLDKRERA